MYIIAKGDGNDTDTNCIAAAKVGGNRNRSAVHSRGPQKDAPSRNAKDTRNGQWEDWGTQCSSNRQDCNEIILSVHCHCSYGNSYVVYMCDVGRK